MCLGEAESQAACKTRALVVVDNERAFCRLLSIEIARAVAVVRHVVVTNERGHKLKSLAACSYVTTDEGVEGMNIMEGIVRIMLIQILALDMPTLRVPVGSSVIHHHTRVVGANFLHAEREVKAAGEEQLSLGREIDALGPIVFLSGQSATVEQSRFQSLSKPSKFVWCALSRRAFALACQPRRE